MAFIFWFVFPLFLLLLSRSKSRFLPLFIVFLLILFSGFRDITFIGDSSNYYYWYDSGKPFFEEHRVELLYRWINLFAIRYGIPFQYIIILMSSITVLFTYLSIKRVSEYVVWGLCIYVLLTFYLYSYNAMRQMAADAILLYSYTFLKDRRYLVCSGLIILAAMFHSTSWLAFALIPLAMKSDKGFSYGVVVLTVIGSYIIGGLNILTRFDFSFIDLLFPKDYISYTIEKNVIASNSFSLSRFIYSVFFLFVYYNYKEEDNDFLYLKIFYIGIILFNLLSFRVEAMRLAYLFTPVQILLFLPLAKKATGLLSKRIVIIYLLFLYYYMTLNQFDALMDFSFCSSIDLGFI